MPSVINIRPTRLEYIRTKRRIIVAQKGLKLLKLKRQALILEFFNASKTAAALRSGLQSELVKGYQSLRLAEMLSGTMRLENEAIKAFQNVHKMVLDVAEKETTLRKLLYEIEKTKRKSNAIENVFIPRLRNAVKFIVFRLAEMERDTFIMLKTVKRKMGEREQENIQREKEILAS